MSLSFNMYKNVIESSFSSDLLIAFLGGLFAAVTALLAVQRTHYLEKKRHYKREKTKRNNKIIYVKSHLSNLIKDIDHSLEKIDKYSNNLINDNYILDLPVASIDISNSILLENFKSQQFFDWHNQVFDDSRVQEFVNIGELLSLYDKQKKSYMEIGKRSNSVVYDIKVKISAKIEELKHQAIMLNDKELPTIFIDEVNKVFDNSALRITDSQNFGDYKRHYLKPLKNVLHDQENNFLVKDLLQIIDEALQQYKIWDLYLIQTKKHIDKLLNSILEIKNELIKNSKHILDYE